VILPRRRMHLLKHHLTLFTYSIGAYGNLCIVDLAYTRVHCRIQRIPRPQFPVALHWRDMN